MLPKILSLFVLIGLARGQGDCFSNPIGVANSITIPDSRMRASSQFSDDLSPAYYGRLGETRGFGAWCPAGTEPGEYLKVDLGDTYDVCGLATQGSEFVDAYAQSFVLYISINGADWKILTDSSDEVFTTFERSGGHLTTDRHTLSVPVTARHLEFSLQDEQPLGCLRVEVYGSRRTDSWALWSIWGACSVTCGRGVQSRTRKCIRPPQNSFCSGSDYQTQSCNTNTCPRCIEGSIVKDGCAQECRCSGGRLVDCTRVRQEFTSMTFEDREAYIKIVREASSNPPYKNDYDRLITIHRTLSFAGIHTRDQFLPWHRWFILEYENLLRRVDCRFTVAYWDWSVVSGTAWRASPLDLWFEHDAGFGSNGVEPTRCVNTGPFREDVWNVVPSAGGGCLTRNFNGNPPDAVAVEEVRRTAASSFNNFELSLRLNLHDNVHCRIGGLMCTVDAATSPEFFLHHSYIDKIWHDWQATSREHLTAHFNTVSRNMAGTNNLHPRLYIDNSNLPENLRVRYQGITARRFGEVESRLGSMTLSELRAIPRASFTGLGTSAIELFNISDEELNEARRLEEKLREFTGQAEPLVSFEPYSVEESLGFPLSSIDL